MSDGRWERELIRIFASAGYTPIRGAASGGGTDRELPDVFAGNGEDMFCIELKTRTPPEQNSACYGPRSDIDNIKHFAEAFRAKPLIAVRWKGSGGRPVQWRFAQPDSLETTAKSFKWYYDNRNSEHWFTFDSIPGEFDV